MPPAQRNNKSDAQKGKDDKNSAAQIEEVIQNAKSVFNLNICSNSSYMDTLLSLHPYSLYQGRYFYIHKFVLQSYYYFKTHKNLKLFIPISERSALMYMSHLMSIQAGRAGKSVSKIKRQKLTTLYVYSSFQLFLTNRIKSCVLFPPCINICLYRLQSLISLYHPSLLWMQSVAPVSPGRVSNIRDLKFPRVRLGVAYYPETCKTPASFPILQKYTISLVYGFPDVYLLLSVFY